MDLTTINILHNTISVCQDLYPCITGSFGFQTCSNDWLFRADQRHCLTLHVGSHQRTVCIVMLEEWNQRSTQTNNLVRSNVHEFNLSFIKNREVTSLA